MKAPLPDEVQKAINILEDYEHYKYAAALRSHIAAQAGRIAGLEAELALVMEWARGRCECCGIMGLMGKCKRVTPPRHSSGCDNWTPAWEVK